VVFSIRAHLTGGSLQTLEFAIKPQKLTCICQPTLPPQRKK
jgi:hypothetical protein